MEKGGSEVGSMWQSCCRLFYEKKRLSSSHLLTNFIYPLWLHHRQPSCLFFFFTICFVQGWTRPVEAQKHSPCSCCLSLSWNCEFGSPPPLDDQDLLTKRKRVSEELRLLLQIGAVKRKKKNSWPAPRLDETE